MQEVLNGLEFRCIGPTRGGRVTAVAAHPADKAIFWFGSTGGGIWKTDDAGTTWQNVSDGFFRRSSVGALAVAPSDPQVLYAGMGETTIRGNVSHGDGLYKSTDGGQTWRQMGLESTRHIGRVVVHPSNPDLVYVAAFGHAHGPNPERGVYRSKDGGQTWDNLLFVSNGAGANFLAIDPHNPRVLYACFWEAERGPYYLNSGGEGSGIWKTTDGGDSWARIDTQPGMPPGIKGKLEVAVSARAGRVWAIVESDPLKEQNGVYRSENGGETWEKLSSDTNLTGRPWYFNHIRADPRDPDSVWVLNFEIWKSVDGGRAWQVVAGPHADYHDLWIDPQDTRRLILGGDGGGCVSLNGAESWSTIYNQPTAEFYHATVDGRFPYRVYGSQQDNTSMSVPSRSDTDAITLTDWYEIGGGESGYIAVRPDDPDVVFAGAQQGILTRYDHARRSELDIAVWPESTRGYGSEDFKFRTNWTSPLVLAPHDPNVLYYASHVVHRSTDEGRAWDVISGDLTRADPETLHASGGRITKDNSGAEVYATIFTLAPSTVDPNVIWAGSDDGLLHVTRDGGATWQPATPSTIPDWAQMSLIDASPHDAATAYLAATRYKMDDFAPYLYKTRDYGQSWTKITGGLPTDEITRVIREDPTQRGLLYAGTETGLWVSFDDGGEWRRVNPLPAARHGLGLPVVPIHDLVVVGDELVVCTHGRSFWILDDLTVIRQLASGGWRAPLRLFRPKDTVRSKRLTGFGNTEVAGRNYLFVGGIVQTYVTREDAAGQKRRVFLDAGTNPPDGVSIQYWLAGEPQEPLELAFLDASGTEIRTIRSKKENADADDKEPKAPAAKGLNRFIWDMRYPDATKLEAKGGDQPGTAGPRVLPGEYQVRLTADGQSATESFPILRDPRNPAGDDDLRAQLELGVQIRDTLSRTNEAINRIRSIRSQVDGWVTSAKGTQHEKALADAAKGLNDKLAVVEGQLIQVRANSPKDTLNLPVMLNSKLGRVATAVASADTRPTRQAQEAYEDIAARIGRQLDALQQIIEQDVPAFNRAVQDARLDAVSVAGRRNG